MTRRMGLTGVDQILAELDQAREFGHICCDINDCTRAWAYEVVFKVAPEINVLVCRYHFGIAADNEGLLRIVESDYDYARKHGEPYWWGDWRAS